MQRRSTSCSALAAWRRPSKAHRQAGLQLPDLLQPHNLDNTGLSKLRRPNTGRLTSPKEVQALHMLVNNHSRASASQQLVNLPLDVHPPAQLGGQGPLHLRLGLPAALKQDRQLGCRIVGQANRRHAMGWHAPAELESAKTPPPRHPGCRLGCRTFIKNTCFHSTLLPSRTRVGHELPLDLASPQLGICCRPAMCKGQGTTMRWADNGDARRSSASAAALHNAGKQGARQSQP